VYILQPIVRHCIAALALLTIAGCRNFNWAPTDALEKVSTTPPNTVEAPVFAPAGGAYNATQFVTLSTSTSGATICYRNDGTNADCDSSTGTCFAGSTTYAGAISVPATITLNAMACKATMNNSALATAIYTIDSTAPVISAISPASATYTTTTQISYTLSESCGVGSITWTRTGGTADPGSPRVQALVGAELTTGAHSAITLTNNPALVSGAVYDISFICTDAAGNAATTVTATGVTFDNVVPVISAVSPANGSFMNTTQVSYTLSEDCNTAAIDWTWTGGAGAGDHNYPLAVGERSAGPHTISPAVALTSGAIYTITFSCIDFAGQAATAVTRTAVTFDNAAPIISGVAPTDSAFVSTTQVSYDLTEVCATASITWTRTGGSADPSSPHVQALTAGEMTAITHTNITITNNPTLVDGAVYQMDFNCTDAASNVATTVTRTNITYDPTAVVISGVSPASSAFRSNTQVTYTLSENCASGNITWTRTGGNPDPGSPRVQVLTGGELASGTKTGITLVNNPSLVDGAVYSVQFNCTDFASNVSTPITVTNVTYDFTAPAISATAPASASFRNNNLVSYTVSENCATGKITWTRVSGLADGSSPHVKALTGAELNAGAHNGIIITNNPTLVDGTSYDVDFDCSDAAGNAGPTITNTGIMYDFTAPTITIQNLRNNGTVHTGHVIGPANDNVGVSVVEFEFESNGTWNPATFGAGTYKFALPMGGTTWRDRTAHQIRVRASDAAGNVTTSSTITVRKGNNRDINGDGYEDIAIGAWAWSSSTGKAYVFYGSPTGITNTTALSSTSIRTGAGTSNFYGRSMAIADFNGDGFGDLAVSAYGNTTNRGIVHIFNGAPGGLSGTSVNITGETTPAPNSKFGSLVVAGDTNSDGFADLVASANGYTGGIGRVYVFHGSAPGISSGVASTATRTMDGEGLTFSNFGGSLALGDFNGDGFTDLAVGAPDDAAGKGRNYIVNGSGAGLPNLTVSPAIAIGTAENTSDFFGGGSAAGDLNNDGVTDLVVGAYGYPAGGNQGRAYVYYGVSGTGIPSGATLDPGGPSSVLTGNNATEFFTTNMAMGDTNSDGFADLVVGGYGCTWTAGCAFVFYGQVAPLTTGNSATAGTSLLGQTAGENFGRAVGTADVNGDGYLDAVVGANLWTTSTGRAFTFHSNSAGPSTSAAQAIAGEASSEFGIHINR
jgi:hypothetical protein